MNIEKDTIHIVTPLPGNKSFVLDPKTGESKVMDFDNPDNEMLRQMCDVLMNRLNAAPDVLKLIYTDNKACHPEIRQIVQDLLDSKLTPEQAREQVLAWKAKLKE